MDREKKIKKILFACTENSGRSQIAEAVFNKLAKARGLGYRAESAGTFPKDKINPLIKILLEGKGYVTDGLVPKQLDFPTIDTYEIIISFGCIVKSTLPEAALKKFEEWHIYDPSICPDRVNDIFIQIQAKVRSLLDDLTKRDNLHVLNCIQEF